MINGIGGRPAPAIIPRTRRSFAEARSGKDADRRALQLCSSPLSIPVRTPLSPIAFWRASFLIMAGLPSVLCSRPVGSI